MGLKASLITAKRALTRRKTKNLSAILAIALGVTLMVGIQITTDTLENTFLTSLLLTEGEVDIRVSNSTGQYLTAAHEENVSALIPAALGIMPELETQGPVLIGSQFEPAAEMTGIPLDFPEAFGSFEDWKTGEIIDIADFLIDNTSVLISSHLAEDMGLDQDTELPITLNTEFNNITLTMMMNSTTGLPIINQTTGLPIFTTQLTLKRVELTIVGIYNSNRPGIGSRYRGLLFSLEGLQDWMSLQDPRRNTDIIGFYSIALITDHFHSEIDRDFLKEQVDALKEAVPVRTENGKTFKIYTVESARLQFLAIIELIFNLLSTMLTVLGFLIVVTGILLITNVQLMSVEDREFQTGVLRAVGENRRGIFQSMLMETLFQGILGGVFGLIGGFIFGQAVAIYLASLFGTGEFSVQPVVKQNVVILSVLIGVLIGIITGLLPALRASRVNIVEALRGIKVVFEEKSGRNFALVGILISAIGCYFFLYNGYIDDSLQFIWETEGWNSLKEWENILLGAGFLFTGLGVILSRYIDRTTAFNLTAIVLWATPVFLYVVAMGNDWITDISGLSINIMIVSIIEIVIGSVLIVGINLPTLMRFLRATLINIRGVKGVAQVAPALISSHKTRSTLTFAIFAVVLTLNVTVAALVSTNFEGTIGQSEEDSRGVDLVVTLSKPEPVLATTSYTEELYKLDSSITDVIGFKTYQTSTDFTKFVALKDPISPDFDPQSDLLPLGYSELRAEQIRGNASSASDDDWRYDFYLESFPDGVRQAYDPDINDEKLLNMSKTAWDLFFDPSYEMPAYNVSLAFSLSDGEFDIGEFGDSGGGFGGALGGDPLEDVDVLKDENGSVITNPFVFTDSFILPLGMQIWVPMNTSNFGFSVYQPFTIGGSFDSQRAGGFPLSTFDMGSMGGGSGDFGDFGGLGSIYIPERYSKYTNFFGEADGITAISRAPDQFDSYLIKTSYAFDDPEIETIAKRIENFTNTEESGYREITGDNFIVATATSLYSKLESNLEMMQRMISFLSIYVNFGLVIGAVGMAVISVRNVAERKREIGMMRAIGFPRSQVMIAALLELVVLGLIGLVIGVVDGLIVNVGFANMQNVTLVIPWGTIGAYVSLIIFVALLAGAIPGWFASRIPAAEALRYVG
ncbi:MAG: ABC transporter permease [Candidatus Odinarchaeota archaeon]